MALPLVNWFKPSPEHVILYLHPNYERMELVQLNPRNGETSHRASIGFQANAITRTIDDVEAFEGQVRTLYLEAEASFNLPLHIVVPSLFTRSVQLPNDIDPEEIEPFLLSEVERSFLFKKVEPAIVWHLCPDSNRIILSAYPREEIEKLVRVCQSLKLPLAAIELNYTSLLKSVVQLNILDEELEEHTPWGLLVVNDNLFFIAKLRSQHLVDILEVPLSTSSGDEHQWMNDIQQDFQTFMANTAVRDMLLVNNLAALNGERLLVGLGYGGLGNVVQQTPHTLASLGSPQPLYDCSLEAMGTVLAKSQAISFPTLDFIPPETRQKMRLNQLESLVLKGLTVVNMAVLMVVLLVWMGVQALVMSREFQLNLLEQEHAKQLQDGLDEAQLRIGLMAKNALQHNQKMNNAVLELLTRVPPSLWVDRLTLIQQDSGVELKLEGGTLEPMDVSQYQQSLKPVPPVLTDNLEVVKLDRAQPQGTAGDVTAVSGMGATNSPTGVMASVGATDVPYYIWSMEAKPPAAPAAAAPSPAPAQQQPEGGAH